MYVLDLFRSFFADEIAIRFASMIQESSKDSYHAMKIRSTAESQNIAAVFKSESVFCVVAMPESEFYRRICSKSGHGTCDRCSGRFLVRLPGQTKRPGPMKDIYGYSHVS